MNKILFNNVLMRKYLTKYLIVWKAVDHICAERIHPNLEEIISDLKKFDHLKDSPNKEITQVKNMPLGTLKFKLRQLPRPNALKEKGDKSNNLKRQIPINTKHGKSQVSGHIGVDFVEHDGGNPSGKYARTLANTGIKIQWFVRRSTLGRDGKAVQGVIVT